VRRQVSVLFEELLYLGEGKKVLRVFTSVERVDEAIQWFQSGMIGKNLKDFRRIDDL
jgi:hypothetical protein